MGNKKPAVANQGAGASARLGSAADSLKRIKAYGAEAIVVSLGVDTFEQDPISFFKLKSPDYIRMGEMIAASGVPVHIGGDRAYYAPALDHVQVPPQPAFFDQINFYRTCFHELCHATGHPTRLARDLANRFGTKGYAREELVAEMGAAFLCASLGIEPTVRHADYIGGWVELLREDLSPDPQVRGTGSPRGRAIFRAASAAGKAADWLLERHRAAQRELAA